MVVGTGEFPSFREAVSPPTQMALCWMISLFLHSLGSRVGEGTWEEDGFKINRRGVSHLCWAVLSEALSLALFPPLEVRGIP